MKKSLKQYDCEYRNAPTERLESLTERFIAERLLLNPNEKADLMPPAPTIFESTQTVNSGSALFGVLEWISLQGGTFNNFNPGLITGKVRGMTYRYFITEGWIGLKSPDCPAGKSIECLTIEAFQSALELHSHNEKDQT